MGGGGVNDRDRLRARFRLGRGVDSADFRGVSSLDSIISTSESSSDDRILNANLLGGRLGSLHEIRT